MNTHFSLSPEELRTAVQKLDALASAMNQVLFGKEDLIELILTGVLARGHILLEGLPGLGKTELVKGLSKALDITARRVQFTPDLLPGDITGTPVLQETDGRKSFVFQEGPVFANIMLADEINRTPPKTQAALLEAMQEKQVTVAGKTRTLAEPFVVYATQNPLEHEGTYPLPEAQLDRFLFKVLVKFPDRQELRGIVELTEGNHPPKIEKVMDRESLLAARACVAQIPIADAVMDYILDLVMATHADNPYIREGASPRAAQALIRTARARAFMENRLNVSFEDVKCVALPVLRHRILLSFDAVSEGITEDAVIGQILTEKEQGLYA